VSERLMRRRKPQPAAWLRAGEARRRIQWYLQAVRPRPRAATRRSGAGRAAVGVAPALQRHRLGGARSVAEVRVLVKEWLTSGKEA
jgi:hypothetical protein